ncbi:hypothetical protein [Variovorax sp. EBFNA2]|uniref:hypothetical protein n=1 Tax=Variovorax sp. EBFNA2 TaxID=3342097 RepID=UPI0029C0A82C|nr:hypothetical protein [Variovorax boronicumulans]WPG38749.1 hypothetical protein RZE79_05300 [Variovorax boronicumulans]
MTAAEKLELKRRARAAIIAPIPPAIRDGSANVSVQYRDDAAVCAAFVRRGVRPDRAMVACLRLEGQQGRL